MREIQVTATVRIPTTPNFLIYDSGSIRVCDIPDDELRRIGEAWTEELISKAHAQREQKPEFAEP